MIYRLSLIFLLMPLAHAEQPNDFFSQYATELSQGGTTFSGFNPSRGELFFKSRHGSEWSCASCHTENPRQSGQHQVTGKAIEPLSPVANATRFTRPARVEKWFRRNCKDVLKRICTPQEKGDVLAYLMSLGV